MAIEKIFPKSSQAVIRSAVSFVQRWKPLLDAADQDELMILGGKMKTWLDRFTPSSVVVSDIMEL